MSNGFAPLFGTYFAYFNQRRGDVAVIKGHLEAMKGLDPRFTDIYRTISRLTVEIGIKKGTLSAEKGKEILQVVGG